MFLDGSSEFTVEDVQTFIDSLPKVLLTRLQLGPNLLADDFINVFTAPLFPCTMAATNPAFAEKHLGKKIGAMITYEEFLALRVREYNQSCVDPCLRIDEALFIETMARVPLVDGVNEKVAAVRAVWADQEGDLMQKVPKLKTLLDDGVAMFRG